jgi:hypothetical protein
VPVTYAFDGRIVVVRLEAEYSSAELHDAIFLAATDLACPSDALLLLDARRSQSLARRPLEEIRATARFLTAKRVRFGSRIGMVAESDVAYGLLHLAQTTLHAGGVAARAFRAMGPARAWLLTGAAAPSADAALALARVRAATGRHGAARCIVDGAGVWWVVSEQPHPPTSGRWCLRFEAGVVARDVADFPPHWFRLEQLELRALGGLA